jgi:hypothetical protein|tara:strand:+ start:3047 stop:3256 length:210 start_codon:yes stop_codon:yes gene_type:complete
MKNLKNIAVTLRISKISQQDAQGLASDLNIATSQVLKWCIESALEIIKDKRENPPLPKSLSLLKKMAKA